MAAIEILLLLNIKITSQKPKTNQTEIQGSWEIIVFNWLNINKPIPVKPLSGLYHNFAGIIYVFGPLHMDIV